MMRKILHAQPLQHFEVLVHGMGIVSLNGHGPVHKKLINPRTSFPAPVLRMHGEGQHGASCSPMKGEKDIRMKSADLLSHFPGGGQPFFLSMTVKRNEDVDIRIVFYRLQEPRIHDKHDFGSLCFPPEHFKERGNGDHIPEIKHVYDDDCLISQICLYF